jgi:hypothetical protein
MRHRFTAAPVCLFMIIIGSASPAVAATDVPAGGDLQQAINNAQPGDTILLRPGVTYSGTFTLPNKFGSAWITIRTAGETGLPGDGERILPAHAPLLAKIRSGNIGPAFQTAPASHHWRLQLLEIQSTTNGTGDIVALGDGSSAQNTLAVVPHDLVVDRVYIHGDPVTGQKRGIALNSASTVITGCYIADIKAVGQEAQAISGWNGPGPFSIVNNYLEGAAQSLLFGGSDPAIPNLVPSDITITGNHFTKQTAWRTEKWVIKNIFELKNARRVTIARNTFEYNWEGGQSGYAILFTVRNQNGACPWCQVDHVVFERNIVRHAAAGIQILGYDNNHPSLQTQAIVIRNNLFADIDSAHWGGNGYFVTLTGGARGITIDHNTVLQDHALGIVQIDGPPVLEFVFTNNLAKHNNYGFIGTNHAVGADSISAFFPASDISRNVLAGATPARYPAGNSFPSVAQFEGQFVAYTAGDYRLSAASPWRLAGSDGLDLGAPLDQPIGAGGSREPPPSRRAPLPRSGPEAASGPARR